MAVLIAPSVAEAACSAPAVSQTSDPVLRFKTTSGAGNLFASNFTTLQEGDLAYDDTQNALVLCNGTSWSVVGSSAAAGSGGYVQFNGSGSFTGDSNFYWDNTNKRLGIGTTSPLTPLEISAPQALRVSSPTTIQTGIQFYQYGAATDQKRWEALADSNGAFVIRTTSDDYVSSANAISIMRGSGYAIASVNFPNGSVGIGTTTVNATLDVNGYAKLKNNRSAPVTCSATYEGFIAYTSSAHYPCFCNGMSWVKFTDNRPPARRDFEPCGLSRRLPYRRNQPERRSP